jgi:hypothetical protein
MLPKDACGGGKWPTIPTKEQKESELIYGYSISYF